MIPLNELLERVAPLVSRFLEAVASPPHDHVPRSPPSPRTPGSVMEEPSSAPAEVTHSVARVEAASSSTKAQPGQGTSQDADPKVDLSTLGNPLKLERLRVLHAVLMKRQEQLRASLPHEVSGLLDRVINDLGPADSAARSDSVDVPMRPAQISDPGPRPQPRPAKGGAAKPSALKGLRRVLSFDGRLARMKPAPVAKPEAAYSPFDTERQSTQAHAAAPVSAVTTCASRLAPLQHTSPSSTAKESEAVKRSPSRRIKSFDRALDSLRHRGASRAAAACPPPPRRYDTADYEPISTEGESDTTGVTGGTPPPAPPMRMFRPTTASGGITDKVGQLNRRRLSFTRQNKESAESLARPAVARNDENREPHEMHHQQLVLITNSL